MSVGTLYRDSRIRTLALVCLSATLMFLLWQSDEPAEPIGTADLRGEADPDGFVVGGRFLSFDENGQLARRFSSERVEQYEADRVTLLQNPVTTLYDPANDTIWRVRADNGRILEDNDILHLTGAVNIVRTTDETTPLELFTETLTLDNNKRTAYTNEPVEIRDALGTTRSVGMKAWIDERILEFNTQVEGRYEPGR